MQMGLISKPKTNIIASKTQLLKTKMFKLNRDGINGFPLTNNVAS